MTTEPDPVDYGACPRCTKPGQIHFHGPRGCPFEDES